MLPELLEALAFRSSNTGHAPVVEALAVLRRYARRSKLRFYAPEDTVPIEGIVPAQWRSAVVEDRPDGSRRVERIPLRAVCAGRAAGGDPPP